MKIPPLRSFQILVRSPCSFRAARPPRLKRRCRRPLARCNRPRGPLTALIPRSASDQQFATAATAAFSSGLAWLDATASALANPNSPMLDQLASLGVQAQQKFQELNAHAAGAASSFPGSTTVISYARAENTTATTSKELARFSSQVHALLDQSQPAFQQINQLFGQLAIAASGGVPTITLAQAEATINTVVSNRTALAASARTLDAPTPLARQCAARSYPPWTPASPTTRTSTPASTRPTPGPSRSSSKAA